MWGQRAGIPPLAQQGATIRRYTHTRPTFFRFLETLSTFYASVSKKRHCRWAQAHGFVVSVRDRDLGRRKTWLWSCFTQKDTGRGVLLDCLSWCVVGSLDLDFLWNFISPEITADCFPLSVSCLCWFCPLLTGTMSPGAEKRLESQMKMLDSMIRDQRSALNLASLLVRISALVYYCAADLTEYCACCNYLKTTLYGIACLLSVPALKVHGVNAPI